MKTIIVSKDGSVGVDGKTSKKSKVVRSEKVSRRDTRVEIHPEKLEKAIKDRGLKLTKLSQEASYNACYLSQSMQTKKISLSMLDVLRKYGISKKEIGAGYHPRAKTVAATVTIDYDQLYEVIKRAMIDALNS